MNDNSCICLFNVLLLENSSNDQSMHFFSKTCNANAIYMSLCMRRPTILVSDQVRHKLACAVTEVGSKLELLDLSRRGFVLSEWRIQRRYSAVQLLHN